MKRGEEHSPKEYWERNIGAFSGFYDRKSEENFNTNFLMKHLYKALVLPIEKKYMRNRHELVCIFIEQNVKPGMIVADIGCGSGIYTKLLANKCARVYAIDYAQSSIELTNSALSDEERAHVELLKFDITTTPIPEVDMVIAIGVLPYVRDVRLFCGNILPYTKRFLFNYLDAANFMNRLRRAFPFLDVRRYCYHDFKVIEGVLKESDFAVEGVYKLATGFIIDSRKI